MEFTRVKIAETFPVGLVCFANGEVALQVISPFNLIVDSKPDGVSGLFDMEGFTLSDGIDASLDYHYNTPMKYKEMPTLKRWLVQQNLVSPVITR